MENDRTDFAFLESLTDEQIEQMAANDPDSFDTTSWTEARLVIPIRKESIHLRVDSDVFRWFKSQGGGHLTRMNAVLRNYYEAHKAK